MGVAASSLEPAGVADRTLHSRCSSAVQGFHFLSGGTAPPMANLGNSTFGSIACSDHQTAVWKLQLRRICLSVRRELNSRAASTAHGLPVVFCSPIFWLSSAGTESLQWQLCLAPLEVSPGSVSLYIQNVSALQSRSGMSLEASFSLHIRPKQGTRDSSSFAAALDKTWTFGADPANQGVRFVTPLEDLQQLEEVGNAEVEFRLHAVQMHTATPLPGLVQSTDPQITLISMQPRILLVENFLSGVECQGIIELARPDLHRSRVARGDMTPSRTSCSTFLTNTKASHPDIQCFEERVSQLISLPTVMRGRRLLTKGEAVQVVRYQAGEFYAEHFDNKADDCCKRACTVMAYLSDVDAGGETYFRRSTGCPVQSLDYPASAMQMVDNSQAGFASRPGLRIPPKQGRAIMFWSRAANGEEDRASLHSGECVKQGEKWIASRWLQEQPTCSFQNNLFVEE